jgi:zona occludens toxin (predicted ATPase)
MSDPGTQDHATREGSGFAAAITAGATESGDGVWTRRLVIFLRVMAVLAIIKGLYHWAQVTGFVGGEDDAFENQPMSWQAATIYFAVIELVAAVGLWLATPWGAVVWLTSVVSMAVIELMFPAIYGSSFLIIGVEGVLLLAYLALAWMAAQERPP